jgi:hypothetical protein
MIKDENLNIARGYFNNIEDQIALLPEEQQAVVFKKCAINCVSNGVLPFLKARYDKCGGNLDLFFSEQHNSEYSFQRVIENGHIYEMGYPRCLCFMHDMGFAKSKIHCECSRQSILYVMHELFPEIVFKVEIIETVLGGSDKCTFKIIVDK